MSKEDPGALGQGSNQWCCSAGPAVSLKCRTSSLGRQDYAWDKVQGGAPEVADDVAAVGCRTGRTAQPRQTEELTGVISAADEQVRPQMLC